MYLPWPSLGLIVALLFGDALAIALGGKKFTVIPDKRQAQDLVRDNILIPDRTPLTFPKVTWDEHSLFVRGERIFLYTGEFHPWRLPVVDLWKDVLQKIKALGYNGVSFG